MGVGLMKCWQAVFVSQLVLLVIYEQLERVGPKNPS